MLLVVKCSSSVPYQQSPELRRRHHPNGYCWKWGHFYLRCGWESLPKGRLSIKIWDTWARCCRKLRELERHMQRRSRRY